MPGRNAGRLVATMAELWSADDDEDVGRIAADAVRDLLTNRDEVIVTTLDLGKGTYRVVGGPTGSAGEIPDHPLLGALQDLERPGAFRPRDPRLSATLRERLEVAGVRELTYRPLTEAEGRVVGCLVVLRRSRRRPPEELGLLLDGAALAFSHLRMRRGHDQATTQLQRASATARSLTEGIATLSESRDVDAVVGHLLGVLQQLDPTIVGLVAGMVGSGLISRVSAVGTTPRSAVDQLRGTRLDGFPIGRRLLAHAEPIFAGPRDVSLATRKRIMEPIGASSLIAAAGRDASGVRIVVSCYRGDPEPPDAWILGSIPSVLDHAAIVLAQLETHAALRAVATDADRGIVILDAGSLVTFANDRARELIGGLSPGEEISDPRWEDPTGEPLPWRRPQTDEPARAVLLHGGKSYLVEARSLATGGSILTIGEPPTGQPVSELEEWRARRTR